VVSGHHESSASPTSFFRGIHWSSMLYLAISFCVWGSGNFFSLFVGHWTQGGYLRSCLYSLHSEGIIWNWFNQWDQDGGQWWACKSGELELTLHWSWAHNTSCVCHSPQGVACPHPSRCWYPLIRGRVCFSTFFNVRGHWNMGIKHGGKTWCEFHIQLWRLASSLTLWNPRNHAAQKSSQISWGKPPRQPRREEAPSLSTHILRLLPLPMHQLSEAQKWLQCGQQNERVNMQNLEKKDYWLLTYVY
jgi:hypothetical protein